MGTLALELSAHRSSAFPDESTVEPATILLAEEASLYHDVIHVAATLISLGYLAMSTTQTTRRCALTEGMQRQGRHSAHRGDHLQAVVQLSSIKLEQAQSVP